MTISAVKEVALASLATARKQIAQLPAPSIDEAMAIEALNSLDCDRVDEASVGNLMTIASAILTSTPEGKVAKAEIYSGAFAKSNWPIAIKILGIFLQNMRNIVCDGQAIKGMVGEFHLSPNELNMLIGTSIADKFGISPLVCRILAALLVMVVDKAAYETFCQMTNDQVIEKIVHIISFG